MAEREARCQGGRMSLEGVRVAGQLEGKVAGTELGWKSETGRDGGVQGRS